MPQERTKQRCHDVLLPPFSDGSENDAPALQTGFSSGRVRYIRNIAQAHARTVTFSRHRICVIAVSDCPRLEARAPASLHRRGLLRQKKNGVRVGFGRRAQTALDGRELVYFKGS